MTEILTMLNVAEKYPIENADIFTRIDHSAMNNISVSTLMMSLECSNSQTRKIRPFFDLFAVVCCELFDNNNEIAVGNVWFSKLIRILFDSGTPDGG